MKLFSMLSGGDRALPANRRVVIYGIIFATVLFGAGCAGNGRGTMTSTQRPFDLAIDGEGFFIVETGRGGYLFTRKGDLMVDSQRYLATTDGYRIAPPLQLPEETHDLAVSLDGIVTVGSGGGVRTIGKIKIAKFTDPTRLEKDGVYRVPTAGSGDPVPCTPGSNGVGTIKSGMIER